MKRNHIVSTKLSSDFDNHQIELFKQDLINAGLSNFQISTDTSPLTIQFPNEETAKQSFDTIQSLLENLYYKNNPIKLSLWVNGMSDDQFQLNTLYLKNKTRWGGIYDGWYPRSQSNSGQSIYIYAIKIVSGSRPVIIRGQVDGSTHHDQLEKFVRDILHDTTWHPAWPNTVSTSCLETSSEEDFQRKLQNALNNRPFRQALAGLFDKIKRSNPTINPNYFPLYGTYQCSHHKNLIVTNITSNKQLDLLLGNTRDKDIRIRSLYAADICNQYELPEDLHQQIMNKYAIIANEETDYVACYAKSVFNLFNSIKSVRTKRSTTASINNGHNLVISAPIENPRLVKLFQLYQQRVGKIFQSKDLFLLQQDKPFFYIPLAIPLAVTEEKLIRLQKNLSEITLSTISIEIDSIQQLPDGRICLQINDLNNHLKKLNNQVVQAINKSGLSCSFTNQFCIPLILAPEKITQMQLDEIEFNKELIYLTSVSLLNKFIVNGMNSFERIANLSGDALLRTLEMENDYLYVTDKNLYLTAEFIDNPLAVYYQLRQKLVEYNMFFLDNEQSRRDACHVYNECKNLYYNILYYGGTPLALYARGLVFQHYSDFVQLTHDRNPCYRKVDRLNQALEYFNQALQLGFVGALKNIGMVHFELENYPEAKQYLQLAMNVGAGDPSTERYYVSIKDRIENEIKAKENESRCRIM